MCALDEKSRDPAAFAIQAVCERDAIFGCLSKRSFRVGWALYKVHMLTIDPRTGRFVFEQKSEKRKASRIESSWGVVTIMWLYLWRAFRRESTISPVPGGMSIMTISQFSQMLGASIEVMALCRIGARQMREFC